MLCHGAGGVGRDAHNVNAVVGAACQVHLRCGVCTQLHLRVSIRRVCGTARVLRRWAQRTGPPAANLQHACKLLVEARCQPQLQADGMATRSCMPAAPHPACGSGAGHVMKLTGRCALQQLASASLIHPPTTRTRSKPAQRMAMNLTPPAASTSTTCSTGCGSRLRFIKVMLPVSREHMTPPAASTSTTCTCATEHRCVSGACSGTSQRQLWAHGRAARASRMGSSSLPSTQQGPLPRTGRVGPPGGLSSSCSIQTGAGAHPASSISRLVLFVQTSAKPAAAADVCCSIQTGVGVKPLLSSRRAPARRPHLGIAGVVHKEADGIVAVRQLGSLLVQPRLNPLRQGRRRCSRGGGGCIAGEEAV